MKTYLVQRAEIKDREEKKGIDSIIALDYMGAAEYEFGAIPDSLKTIRENIPDYTYLDVPINGKIITVFCNSKDKTFIQQYLKDLASGKFYTKNGSYFDQCVNPSKFDKEWQIKHPLKINFWWDLDNNLMFWVKNNEFELKFKSLIEVKPK